MADESRREMAEMIKIIRQMSGSRTPFEIFSDFVEMSSLAIANSVCIVNRQLWDSRERQYLDITRKYKFEELQNFSELLALLTVALENEIYDVLGSLFMAAGMGSSATGQFFTPFHVSVMAAATSMDVSAMKNSDEIITLNEPSCGAGGMIIAAASVLKNAGINYQKRLRVIAQDLDWKAVYMCYLQLSLLGISGEVIQGNTLGDGAEHNQTHTFYTPARMGVLI